METQDIRAYLAKQPNLKAFCRETGFSYSTLHKFVSNTKADLKGVTKGALELAIFQKEMKK